MNFFTQLVTSNHPPNFAKNTMVQKMTAGNCMSNPTACNVTNRNTA